jgi:hypothetical protein
MIEETKAVQRWAVEAHEGGGFVAVGDYMTLRAENKRLNKGLADANLLAFKHAQEIERLREKLSLQEQNRSAIEQKEPSLSPQEQAEPVAWMSNGGCGSVIAAEEKSDGFAYTERFCIPLYTAPQGQTVNAELRCVISDLGDQVRERDALLRQALEQLRCNTDNMNKGMSKSIQRLCARENKAVIQSIKQHLGEAT